MDRFQFCIYLQFVFFYIERRFVFIYNLFFFTSNSRQQTTSGKRRKSNAKWWKESCNFDRLRFVFFYIIFLHIERQTTNHKRRTAKVKRQTMKWDYLGTLIGFGFVFFYIVFFTSNGKQHIMAGPQQEAAGRISDGPATPKKNLIAPRSLFVHSMAKNKYWRFLSTKLIVS